ncbi:MAG: class I SAM-dependent methyltransferase [Candidatus Nanoarchaeia archaeon]|jgi:SAM-dependent methyltransferase
MAYQYEKVRCVNHNKKGVRFIKANDVFDPNIEYTYVKCPVCGLIYANPRFDSRSINDYYKNIYSKEDFTVDASYLFKLKKLQFSFNRKIKSVKNGRLLDIGCGDGFFLRMQKERGWEVYGQDINPKAVKNLEKMSIKCYSCDINKMPKKNYFDVVTLFHVLEHISNPKKFLLDIKSLLKKNGSLVIEVPNINSFEAKIFKSSNIYLGVPVHFYQFSEQSLRFLLESVGFIVKSVKYNWASPQAYTFSFIHLLEKTFNFRINVKTKFLISLLLIPVTMPLHGLASLFKKSNTLTLYAKFK